MTALREARKLKGISQEKLAALVGVSQAHISCLEKMSERASPVLAEKLVKTLGRRLITEEQVLYPERFLKRPRRKAA